LKFLERGKILRKGDKTVKKFLVTALLSLIAIGTVNAQLTATAQVGVTVTVSSVNSITLSQSGGSLTFDPATGQTNTIQFNTTYNLDGTATSIKLYSWFSTPAAALATSNNNNISSSQIAATFMTSGVSSSSGVPCNQAPGIGSGVVDGGACAAALLNNQSLNGGPITSSGGGSIATTYSLAILNYGPSLKLAAGAYTGTLNVMAFAS